MRKAVKQKRTAGRGLGTYADTIHTDLDLEANLDRAPLDALVALVLLTCTSLSARV